MVQDRKLIGFRLNWSLVIGHWLLVIGHWSLVIGHWSFIFFNSHLAPVHKYLIGSVTTINSNAETIKSYHCCQMSCCLLPLFTSKFSTWCKI
ncbi:MAG: hypothetical protein F6K31_16755 [Symploca sp. SIO2G7]|nr:hypothetical protein [Symploca sp. SIO2G7]